MKILKESRWSLGFKDRGMGHGDFGVMFQLDGQEQLVVECACREIADYLIETHNASLTATMEEVQ